MMSPSMCSQPLVARGNGARRARLPLPERTHGLGRIGLANRTSPLRAALQPHVHRLLEHRATCAAARFEALAHLGHRRCIQLMVGIGLADHALLERGDMDGLAK